MTENVDLAEVRRLIRRLRVCSVYELPAVVQDLAAAVPEPTPQMPVVVHEAPLVQRQAAGPTPPRRRFY